MFLGVTDDVIALGSMHKTSWIAISFYVFFSFPFSFLLFLFPRKVRRVTFISSSLLVWIFRIFLQLAFHEDFGTYFYK